MSSKKGIALLSASVALATSMTTPVMAVEGVTPAKDISPSPVPSKEGSKVNVEADPVTPPENTPPTRVQAQVEKVELYRTYVKDGTTYSDKGISYNNRLWFKESGSFELKVTGTANGELQQVKVTVDGSEVYNQDVTTSSTVAKFNITDTSKEVKLFINGSEVTILNIGIDKAAPTGAKAVFSSDVIENEGETLVSKGSTVALSSLTDDDGNADYLDSGIKSITFEHLPEGSNNWVPLGTVGSDDITHQWDIPSNGEYRWVVTDNAGNEAVFNLADVAGVSPKIKLTEAKDSAITSKVNGVTPNEGWYTSPSDISFSVTSPTGLTKVTVYVNGEEVDVPSVKFLSKEYTGAFKLSDLPVPSDGVYNVNIVANGIFGINNTDSFVVKMDSDDPHLTDVSLTSKGNLVDNTIYLRDNTTLNWSAIDNHSGVAKVELTYTDESGSERVFDVTKDTSFNLATGTGYRLKVVDNVGKEREYSLTDLGLESNNFLLDTNAPTIIRTDKVQADFVDSSNNKWLRTSPVLGWNVSDNNLSNVKIYVNGEEVSSHGLEDSYNVDLSKYASGNGKYDVKLVAVDKSGNVSENTDTYYVDSTAPVDVSVSLGGDFIDRGYGIFSKGVITLKPGSTDIGSGVSHYELLDSEGKVLATLNPGDTTALPGTAKFIRVYDMVGNVTESLSIHDLAGISGKGDFYIDSSTPNATINLPAGQYEDWYKSDVDFTVDFTDNLSLYNGYVTINGKRVSEFTANSIESNHTLNVSTQGIATDSNGAYVIVAHVTDSAGNEFEVSRTIYKDVKAPEIVDFIFTDLTYSEGQSIAEDDRYGFFTQGATSVTIVAKDEIPGSGVASITYTLRNDDGSFHSEGVVNAVDGRATVSIPNNFKGYISAVATDKVGNVSASRKPSGVITEDRNWHVNTSSIDITLPGTESRDSNGNWLYNKDVSATVAITQGTAGIRSIEWGIGDQTLGTTNVDINGKVSGDAVEVTSAGKNLVYSVRDSLPVTNEVNGQKVWVRAVDRAGHTSSDEEIVSIDKTAPKVTVEYDRNKESTYYNSDRIATITVVERNFDPSKVNFGGEYGSVGEWVNIGNDTWQARVIFSGEKEYNWNLSITDRAGNTSDRYSSETFTIDKTTPVVDVTFNDNNPQNGNYYNTDRTATVSVVDATFDQNAVKFDGNGKLGSWVNVGGNRWESVVTWDGDGEREFNITISDKAENVATPFNSGKFVVDTATPELTISGVKNGTSYRNPVDLLVSTNDKNIDLTKSRVSLKSRKMGEIKLNGELTKTGGGFVFDAMTADRKWDDLYIIEADIVDMAGNQRQETVTFSINRYGSTFDFLNEDFKGKFFQELPSDVELEQFTVDRMDINKYSVVVLKDGKQVDVPSSAVGIAESGGDNKDWKYNVNVNKDLFNKNDGIYQVQLHAESENGVKESTVEQEYTFGIDSTSPEVIISGLESKGSYNDVSKDVTVEIRDLSGPEELSIKLNGKDVDYREENGLYHFTVPASSDKQNVQVDVVDKAGNRTLKSADDFFISTNVFETIRHNKWFGWLIGLIMFIAAGLFGYIFKKRKDDEKLEEERQKLREEALKSSAGSSSAGTPGTGLMAGAVPLGEEAEGQGTADIRLVDDSVADKYTPEVVDVSNVSAVEDSVSTDYFDEHDETVTNVYDEQDNVSTDVYEED